MKDSNEIEFTDLEQWRAAAKAAHPRFCGLFFLEDACEF